MSVRKDPDGRWRYRKTVTLPDGTKDRISGTPKHENTRIAAEEAERAHIEQMLHPPAPAPQKVEVPTVATFATKFLESIEIKNRDASYRTMETQFRCHILPHLGHLTLDEVSYGLVEDWKVTLANKPLARRKRVEGAEPEKLSARWVNECMMSLHTCLKAACKRGLIATVPEFEWLPVPAPEFDFLTFEEAERLIDDRAIDEADREWRTMLVVALRTGMRQGELMALHWEDVDLGGARIIVKCSAYKNRAGTWVIGPTKTGKIREVPLSGLALQALTAHQHQRGPLVFCASDGRMFRRNETYAPLNRALARAGLRSIGWHCLRHTFASHLVMRGARLKAVQELLGHANILMTMRYSHLAPEVSRDAVRLLDRPVNPESLAKNLPNFPGHAVN